MWIQFYKGDIKQIQNNDTYGYASNEEEAEQHAEEYPFLYALDVETPEGHEALFSREGWPQDWPTDEIWEVFADGGAPDWFAGKPHLCDQCIVHDCTTPEMMRYVPKCEDRIAPRHAARLPGAED